MKIINNVNFNALSILAKMYIIDARRGSECASAGEHNKALKFQVLISLIASKGGIILISSYHLKEKFLQIFIRSLDRCV